MRISDWSSDVCSSDLLADKVLDHLLGDFEIRDDAVAQRPDRHDVAGRAAEHHLGLVADREDLLLALDFGDGDDRGLVEDDPAALDVDQGVGGAQIDRHVGGQHAKKRSEEHTSELQSLMRSSYAVVCLKKKKTF